MLSFDIWDKGFLRKGHTCYMPSNLFELVNGILDIVMAPRD
jgi:hypothetical protein